MVAAIQHTVAELRITLRSFTAHAALKSDLGRDSSARWPVRQLVVEFAPSAEMTPSAKPAILLSDGVSMMFHLRRAHTGEERWCLATNIVVLP